MLLASWFSFRGGKIDQEGCGIGEVSWALQALAFELLDTVLDLTGSVDGEQADEDGQGLEDALDSGGVCVLAGVPLLFFCIIAASLLS